MMSVAVATLLDEGIGDPRDHLFLVTTDKLATLMVSRAPFTAAELASLSTTVDKLGFTIAARPHAPAASPVLTGSSPQAPLKI
jgi:hypothetical protein